MKARQFALFRCSAPISVALTAALIGHFAAPCAHATALTWTGGDGNWGNGTTGGWSGTWSNTNPDTGTFNGPGGNVTLTTAITTGNSTAGATAIAFSSGNYTLRSDTLTPTPIERVITLSNGAGITIGNGVITTIGEYATVSRSAGTGVIVGNTTATSSLNVGSNGKLSWGASNILTFRNLTLDLKTGGTITNGTSMVVGDNSSNANTTLNMSGGTVTIDGTGTALVLSNNSTSASGGEANLKITGGNITFTNPANTNGIRIGGTSGTAVATGTVDLEGGTVTTNRIFEATGGANHTSTLNLHGGTLKALGNQTNFIAVDNVWIKSGGVNFDTNGKAITVAKDMKSDGNSTGGGLILNDTAIAKGTLTLTGNNTYTGNTTITAGTLRLSGAVALATPNISVASGATVDVSALSPLTLNANLNLLGGGSVVGSVITVPTTKIFPGTDGTAGTLTFKNNLTLDAATTTQFDLSSSFIGSNDKMVLDGTGAVLAPNNAQITIKSAGTLDTTADYVLIDLTGSGASFSGSFDSNPVWAGTTPGNAASFSIVTDPTQVKLRYTAPAGILSGVGLATPGSVTHGASPLLTVTVTPATGPASTGIAVAADLSSIGGSAAQAFFDDGSNGDVTPGDNVFSYSYTIPGSVSLGVKGLTATVTDAEARNASAGISLTVVAANVTWGAAPAGANWGTGAHWAGGVSPGVGDLVFFDASTELSPNLETAYSVDRVTFNSGAGSYTLGGSTLTLTGGGVTNDSTTGQTLNVPVDMGTSQTFNAASGDITLGGAVSGSGKSLTKTGAGALTLFAANSYSGPTLINAGTLVLSGTGTLGNTTADLTMAGGGLDLGGSSQTVGAVSISAPAGFGDTIGNGNLTGTSYAASSTAGTAIISANLLVNGAAGFAKTGAGTVTLSGNNTYTGTTAISAGRIIALHANALGSTAGNTTVAQEATLALQGDLSFAAEPLSIASGGANTVLLRNESGDNTWNGTITTTGAGSFARISSDSGLLTVSNTITVSDAATSAVFQGAGNILVNGQITGPGRLFSGSTGAGTRTLANTGNDFNGLTTISGGTLKLGAGEVIPHGTGKGSVSITGAAATLDLASFSETLNGLSNTGTNGIVDNSAANTTSTLTVGDTDATSSFGGTIQNTAGTVALNKIGNGTLTLSGANTYSGNTTVTAGTLTLGNAPDPLNANTGNDASTVTIAATGATLNLTYTGTDLIKKLVIGASQMNPGIYGHTNSTADNGGLGVGFFDAYFGPGAGTLTVTSADYASWINSFAFTGFVTPDLTTTGDPDNDGLKNAVENLLGTSPEVFSTGLTSVSASGGNLVFRHTLSATPATDLTGAYEWSTDLVNWNADAASAGGTTVTFGEPVVITPGTPDLVEVTAAVTGTPVPKVFARFKATQN